MEEKKEVNLPIWIWIIIIGGILNFFKMIKSIGWRRGESGIKRISALVLLLDKTSGISFYLITRRAG